MSTTKPLDTVSLVSVILPVYNRLSFLPAAIAAIQSQKHDNWELIIIDDGSTDGTQDSIQELTATIHQPVQFIRQENQGAYGARNTGLDHSTGRYIAFYDSDDVWLPHHLADCVTALDEHDRVDWVFAACKIIDLNTKQVTCESTFHPNGSPRPFLGLDSEKHEELNIIIDENAASCQIEHGLYCGLQNSVIRKELFETHRFEWESRNEAEDQIFAIQMLSQGKTLAYFDNVHVNYHIHSANSSCAGSDQDLDRKERVTKTAIAGFERLIRTGTLNARTTNSLRKRLRDDYFWKLGYAVQQNLKMDHLNAIQSMKKGLCRHWPNLSMIKTFIISFLRLRFSRH